MSRNCDDCHLWADILRWSSPFCMYSSRGWSYSSPSNPTLMSAYRRRRPRLPRFPSLGPLPLAVVLVAAIAWYHFGFSGFVVRGAVVDSVSGQPIAGARVWSARSSSVTGPEGEFSLDRIKPPEAISFDQPGYRGQTLRVTSPFDELTPRLEPISVEIDAVDGDSGQAVSAILDGPTPPEVLGKGRLRL